MLFYHLRGWGVLDSCYLRDTMLFLALARMRLGYNYLQELHPCLIGIALHPLISNTILTEMNLLLIKGWPL